MRTIFLRIFLAFWAAMLLVLLTISAVAWYRLTQYHAADANVLVVEAAKRFKKEGLPGLRKWIVESERVYAGRVIYVIDHAGVDVLYRALPGRFQKYIGRLELAGLLQLGAPRDREPDPLLLTPQFLDEAGNEVYTVMIDGTSQPLTVLKAADVRLMLLAFALVISGFVCWWLARYVSKPVERLQASARSLAAGNLEARVGQEFSRRRDELGVLARDFDAMAERVRTLIAAKEELLRGVSHELRSPLARMRVALGLARRSDADLGRQFDRIELETERLDTLIGQVLQLSHLGVREPTPACERVDLTDLLSEVVEDARLEASAAGKSVEWTPGERVQVEGDPSLLRSAAENVLRNAVRFTLPATAVRVMLERERGQAAVVIEDCGPGAPEADLDRIFEPFYRIATSRDRDSGGTGLGLAITARIVRLYGGEIHATNMTGGGLRIELRLPALARPSRFVDQAVEHAGAA